MAWLIAGATVSAWVLALLGVIPVWAAVVATLAIAFIAAWLLDRTRSRGPLPPYFDANQGNFQAPMNSRTWQVPTAYIDHPTGGGPPPGVERHGERSRPWPPGSDSDDRRFGRR